MNRKSVICATATLITFAAPHALVAQAPSDAIPREVVMAILRNSTASRDAGIVLETRLPPDIAASISIPPQARVIATLIGGTTEVIGTTRGTADSVRMWFANDFERRGYVPVETIMGSNPFVPAERSPSAGYCGARQVYSAWAQPRQRGEVEFVVRIQPSRACSADMRNATVSMMGGSTSGPNPPSLPLLYHPRAAEVGMQCMGTAGGFSSRSTQAAIATSTGPQQLLAHYGQQLESNGWKRETQPSAVGSWTRPDSTNRMVRLNLIIEAGPGGPDCRNMRMTATEVRP